MNLKTVFFHKNVIGSRPQIHSFCIAERDLQKRTPLKALGLAQTPQEWLELQATTFNVFLQAGLDHVGKLSPAWHPHSDHFPDGVSVYTGLIHTESKTESLSVWQPLAHSYLAVHAAEAKYQKDSLPVVQNYASPVWFSELFWCLSLCLTQCKEWKNVPAYEKTVTLFKEKVPVSWYPIHDEQYQSCNTAGSTKAPVLQTCIGRYSGSAVINSCLIQNKMK